MMTSFDDDPYLVYWSLLSSSRALMAGYISAIRAGLISNEVGIAAARAVLLEREAMGIHDLDGQRRLAEEYRRRYAELRAGENPELP